MSGKSFVTTANEYARKVVAGKIPACLYVRLACQRHLDDLKKKHWRYIFDAKKANRVCHFIELLPHTKGKWAAKGEHFVMSPWQVFVNCVLFGWVDKKTKYRRFREGYLEVPRKSGKSFWAAAIGLYMFCADGEFGAECYSGATTEKQAWEIFRPARLIALRTDDLREQYGIEVHASNLAIAENGSRFEPIIGNPGDGASPSCALIDEYHEHPNDSLYETMTTGMAAREQPLILIVTTAGSNLAGPCYAKRGEVINVLQGVTKADTQFGIIFTIDEADEWTSIEALKKANPNYGISAGEDYLLDRQQQAMRSARLQNGFKTKHLNLWVGAATAWMDMLLWKKQPARKTLEELQGRPCFIGIDLAAKRDVAAMVLLFPPVEEDEPWHVHGRYYLPEDVIDENVSSNTSHYDAWAKEGYLTLTPGAVIDYEAIKDDIRDFSSQFIIKAIAYDRAYAWEFSPSLLAEGLPMVEIMATVLSFSEPMKRVEALVAEKLLAHGNCPMLTWMMSNVVAQMDKKENIYPRKEQPDNKIDGPVALIMAMNRALLEADTTSIYDKGARL